ncbi:PCNA-interacting partner isoform X6 [Neomonachus schauinslandi]|uniref:PCNA-interacting partner n=1 Tax=Neomonachus schauinslandi TaxID=29088 RepID=A0A8M1M9W0_NEOSC|nr:PCNA-interacting partner isoform X6 [Neomonachus schauinslandi]
MAELNQKSILDMIKEFRRNWHTLCNSERTTVCGADSMLLALQLSMAENNKQSQLRDFLSGREYVAADETDLYVPTSPMSKHNQDNEKVQLLARKIIYSYLSLLVNSKNDLALAHVLNIPDRGLGREAFTDLKHAAQEKKMSIFLVATSFIRTLELGGKGYAPSPSDPLRAHVKGLSNFINFVDKLDEILGEIPNPRSPTQVNNSSVKPLRERIHKSMQEKKNKMKQTLIRSQFACTYKDDCTISKDKWNDVNSASKPLYVLHMENDLSEGINSSVGRPTIGTSSGNVHLDRSKSEKLTRKSSSQTGNKSSKRKQVDLDDKNDLCDNGNEPPQHKNVKIPETSNNFQNKLCGKVARVAKNKCTAKHKLITGQTKLTQFFRL